MTVNVVDIQHIDWQSVPDSWPGMLVYIEAGTKYAPSTRGGCRFLRLGFA